MNLSDLFIGNNPTLASILWPLIAGVVIAACAVFFHKQTIGKFVKKLLTEKADTPETAKSLSDLGFEKNKLVKWALRPDTTLRKIIFSAENAEENAPARYYIPEDKAYRAEVTYNPDGASLLAMMAAIVVFILLAFLMALIPDLIQMAKNAISSF